MLIDSPCWQRTPKLLHRICSTVSDNLYSISVKRTARRGLGTCKVTDGSSRSGSRDSFSRASSSRAFSSEASSSRAPFSRAPFSRDSVSWCLCTRTCRPWKRCASLKGSGSSFLVGASHGTRAGGLRGKRSAGKRDCLGRPVPHLVRHTWLDLAAERRGHGMSPRSCHPRS
eukprot:scaffold1302_cov245-Pinguiococcus_pyrenoidosus.AAC.10